MSNEGWTFSAEVLAKASAYLHEKRVYADADVPGVFWVRGTDPMRRYRVQTDADPRTQTARWVMCSCPHGTNVGAGAARCSHAVAALLAVRDGLRLPLAHMEAKAPAMPIPGLATVTPIRPVALDVEEAGEMVEMVQAHVDWHEDLIVLTAYMAAQDYSAGDIAYAVSKPHKYVDVLAEAKAAARASL